MLVMPGPPSSRKIGSAGCAERALMRVTGIAISRDFGSRRFSRTIIVPQSAARGPASVSYVHDFSVSWPACAPFGTLGGSSPRPKPRTPRPAISHGDESEGEDACRFHAADDEAAERAVSSSEGRVCLLLGDEGASSSRRRSSGRTWSRFVS